MSLSRTPSPVPGGGWSSPGLSTPDPQSRRADRSRSPAARHYGELDSARKVTWDAAQAQTAQVKRFQPKNQGFFRRHFRKLSSSLPKFHSPVDADRFYKDKQHLPPVDWRLPRSLHELKSLGYLLWRKIYRYRLPLALLTLLLSSISLFYLTRKIPLRLLTGPVPYSPALAALHYLYRRSSFFGGGSKFLIILAANQGGGVMEWKGPREWAIERDSVRNKKRYAQRWGYDIEIVDMAIKKRYAHEWRESWEKVDILRRCMQDYPDVEWFWWLDLNTYIMEPSLSLQSHIFNSLATNTYRDINHWNPLNITHPLSDPWLDAATRSPVGDNDPSSIDIIVPQDCDGFNLGSFFVRRSPWTDHLLDVWWDPVHYEQRHMQWEHKEQDAFEYLYTSQPWVRPHTAFFEQRKMNSFPVGACGDKRDPLFHYDARDRDFMVNMAGCEWGRDCWAEMYHFRELSYSLNKGAWERLVDGVRDTVRAATGTKVEVTKDVWPPRGEKENEEHKKPGS